MEGQHTNKEYESMIKVDDDRTRRAKEKFHRLPFCCEVKEQLEKWGVDTSKEIPK